MIRSLIRASLTCIPLLFLAGCFDLDQSLLIEPQRVVYTAEIRADARLVAMSRLGSSGRQPSGFCETIKAPSETRKLGVEVQVTESTAQGQSICTVRVSGPIDAFISSLDRGVDSGFGKLSVKRIDADTLQIDNVLDPQTGPAAGRGIEGALAESMFAGRMLRWSVSAPRVITSNGVIASDSRSVDWAVPLSAALKERQHFQATVRVELTTFERIRLWFIDQWRAIRKVLRTLLAD